MDAAKVYEALAKHKSKPGDRKVAAGTDFPDHVEMTEDGPICFHCGGSVDAKGYAEGGEVKDDEYGDIKAIDRGMKAVKSERGSNSAARLYEAALRRKQGG